MFKSALARVTTSLLGLGAVPNSSVRYLELARDQPQSQKALGNLFWFTTDQICITK